jgi:hypothetical protein
MTARLHSYVTAGVALIAAGAIAIAPTVAPLPTTAVSHTEPVAGQVSKARVELLAAVQHMTTAVRQEPTAATTPSPAPLNTASDFIVAAWNAALPWIDYGVNLTDYVLGFIPFGYLVGDQISIVYYSLVRPVANSFVVDLVAPVVNAPLNVNSYVNGLVALGSVTVTSLINLGINEFNYFLGWLIPPIPPIPLAAPATTPAPQTLTATAHTDATVTPDVTTPAKDQQFAKTSKEEAIVAADAVAETGDKEAKVDAAEEDMEPKATSSADVTAQGKVRNAGNETPETTKVTNGSKKSEGQSTAKDGMESSASSPTNDDGGTNGEKKDKKE